LAQGLSKYRQKKTINFNIKDTAMKKIMMVLVISAIAIGTAYTQVTVNQNLTLSVGSVFKMTASGDPGALAISDGTAGTDALNAVTDNSTTYSITQNYGNTVKITAQLNSALDAGYTLTVNLASSKGTSLGAVDISNGSAQDAVQNIALGADANRTITYSFSALASAGTLASTSKTVTLTLTN
jgi:hypothetical protein